MATGTLSPDPYLTVVNASGVPYVGAKVYTYIAGTTTPAATYTDVGLTVANANPIVTDSAGRYTVFLAPGASYKYVIQDSTGAAIKTIDNISSVPGSSSSLDITGTAGETLTAGQAVYLSDGSGAKTAGQWFKADAANAYSSTTPEVGMVPATITSGASGTIRLAGQITGLVSLTIGTSYYVGTAGALTATAPVNTRQLGVADTTSSLVLGAPPPIVVINNAICQGRLTLTTGVPVTTADVTAATAIKFTPYAGNLIALYGGTIWSLIAFTELSIAVPATTSQLYDVFCFNNAGVATLELLAWTNDTTRATALVTQDGVLSKTGALTRRYLGSVRTTTVSGQTEDSFTKRYVWNYYNRVPRGLLKLYADASWGYTVATLRQANANAANQLDIVIGVAEVPVSIQLTSIASNDTGGMVAANGIGFDSTSAMLAGSGAIANINANTVNAFQGRVEAHYPTVGRHIYVGLEWSGATGTTTWYGTSVPSSGPTGLNSGLRGFIPG